MRNRYQATDAESSATAMPAGGQKAITFMTVVIAAANICVEAAINFGGDIGLGEWAASVPDMGTGIDVLRSMIFFIMVMVLMFRITPVSFVVSVLAFLFYLFVYLL